MNRDELIAALEAATGPDRALDREIGELIGQETGTIQCGVKLAFIDYAPYTSSRDAMLPGAEKWLWSIHNNSPHEWRAGCKVPDVEGIHYGIARTEPLARRIAEIKALVP